MWRGQGLHNFFDCSNFCSCRMCIRNIRKSAPYENFPLYGTSSFAYITVPLDWLVVAATKFKKNLRAFFDFPHKLAQPKFIYTCGERVVSK